MLDAVAERLRTEVADLGGHIDKAARLADVMRDGRPPSSAVAAFVMPAGLRGGKADVISGAYRQPVEETISVVLFARSGSRNGDRALEDIEALIMAVIRALAGWTPGDTVGVFHFVQSGVLSFEKGILIYQWQFAISDQLRIIQ